MRPAALLTVTISLVLTVAAGAAQQQSAPQVAAALQARYDRISDFTADFTQHYQSGVLKRKTTERGTLQVKKPGKMRWDYTSPEKKLFVSDGSRIWLYVPADKQATVTSVPPQDEATTAVLFLVGKGNLTRDFSVSFLDQSEPGTHGLRLQPKLPERDYDWLEIVVDASSLQIRSLTAADRQGGQSTFVLSNIKENVGLTDKTFAFTPPRGTDVIEAGKSSR